MLGHPPWNSDIIKKVTILFGCLFNDIKINRTDSDDAVAQVIKVPLLYGPADPQLMKSLQTPDIEQPFAMTLPRMAYELIDLQYDANRQLPSSNQIIGNGSVVYSPAPYIITYDLAIMVNKTDDALRILEQILAFFTPSFNIPGKIMENLGTTEDLPVTLVGINKEDSYEGALSKSREYIWRLTFQVPISIYGPVNTDAKLIKHVESVVYSGMTIANKSDSLIVYPGLTENGEPTTDPSQAIPWNQVNEDDNWAFIDQIQGNDPGYEPS